MDFETFFFFWNLFVGLETDQWYVLLMHTHMQIPLFSHALINLQSKKFRHRPESVGPLQDRRNGCPVYHISKFRVLQLMVRDNGISSINFRLINNNSSKQSPSPARSREQMYEL